MIRIKKNDCTKDFKDILLEIKKLNELTNDYLRLMSAEKSLKFYEIQGEFRVIYSEVNKIKENQDYINDQLYEIKSLLNEMNIKTKDDVDYSKVLDEFKLRCEEF